MILIIDCGSKKTKEIKKVLGNAGFKNQIKSLSDIDSVEFNKFSGIIISGSGLSAKSYMNKFKFVKELKIPILGICFGHQVIGLLYGSEIYTMKRDKGKHEIELLEESKLFNAHGKNHFFEVENHREAITLPRNFVWLATSNSCKIEAMNHKKKNIYGVQFHPEVSGENGKQILINFCNICTSHS
ncbi:gamma-glutamyl-gamma-aminobutyrate hydrolase family protein [Candidatus Woesearchaeota archaeon]|nr:gamma-glutamyl-gamma-aminobutyrate hydrolase family protein [Candidatus Woesearchaeota archaeon]